MKEQQMPEQELLFQNQEPIQTSGKQEENIQNQLNDTF